jgi:hypothetical protein
LNLSQTETLPPAIPAKRTTFISPRMLLFECPASVGRKRVKNIWDIGRPWMCSRENHRSWRDIIIAQTDPSTSFIITAKFLRVLWIVAGIGRSLPEPPNAS